MLAYSGGKLPSAATLGEFLFTDEMQRNTARVWMCAVFPQINPLPCPKHGLPGMHRQAQVHRCQRAADVRGHVVVAFRRVAEQCIAIRHEP